MRTRKRNIVFNKGDIVNGYTFIEDMPSMIISNKPYRMAKFICRCGKEFITRLYRVTKLGIGCGCRQGGSTHGLSRKYLSEYKVWQSIKQKCYNSKDDHYKN